MFSEEPFGSIVTAPDTNEIAANANGDYGLVVTEVSRSDGLGGWHRTSYAYSDRGRESTKNWGYLGFYATRVTDEQSGIVTYYQFRLDTPHLGKISAMHQYDADFDNATEILTKTETDLAVMVGATSEIVIPYRAKITSMLFEGTGPSGTPVGIMQVENVPTVALGEVNAITTTSRTAASFTETSGGGTFWGDVPEYTLNSVDRTVETTKTYNHETSGSLWLIGFLDSIERKYYDGSSTTGSLDQTQDADFTRYGNTNHIETRTHFPTDPEYTLTTTYGYTPTGHVETETTVGDNVASRTSSALNFIEGRYPTTFRNPLNHDNTVLFDNRFGAIKSVTDPNSRQTSAVFDAFGREISRTSPDGVVTTKSYDRCVNIGGCPLVNSIAPVSRVQTVSQKSSAQVAPIENVYLDVLGRVVRTEIEGFDGTYIRQDTLYDVQGRVHKVSQPYLVTTGSQHFVEYEYDLRDRLSKQTRPDGSYFTIEHSVESGIGVRRTIKERVLKSDGTNLETNNPANHYRERYEIFDRLGQLAESVDDSDAIDGKSVKTSYTYYGSGNPKTITVDSGSSNLVTTLEYDDGGNQTSITGPDVGIVKSKYTALGELREIGYGSAGTDLLTTFSYDLLGRLTNRVDQDATSTWQYDTAANGIGYLHLRSYGSSFTETLSYGSNSLVDSVSTSINAGGMSKNFTHNYLHDSSGRLEFVTFPSGIQIEQDYNAYGYLESVTDTATQTALKTYIELDAFGNPTEEAYGNGVESARSYDPKTGRLTEIDTTIQIGQQVSIYQQNRYKWQSNGLLESRSQLVGGSVIEELFQYDGLNRLTSATTDLVGTDRVLTTSYDDRGNLLSKTSSVAADTDVSNYQYASGKNRLDSVNIAGDTYALSYDSYGNITTYDRPTGDDKFIDWNARNLPSRVTIGSSRNTTSPTARDEFEYGPDDQRFYKKTTWDDGQDQWIEHTFYVGSFEELVTDSKDTAHNLVQKSRIGDNVLHVKTIDYLGATDSSIEYLHRDHLGSVEVVTDEQGLPLRVLGFDPFGSRRKDDWTAALSPSLQLTLADDQRKSTSRGFTGHEHMDRTGFIHMNGRLYDPQLDASSVRIRSFRRRPIARAGIDTAT